MNDIAKAVNDTKLFHATVRGETMTISWGPRDISVTRAGSVFTVAAASYESTLTVQDYFEPATKAALLIIACSELGV